MEYFLIGFLLLLLFGFFRFPRTGEGETEAPPELTAIPLQLEEDREVLEWNGARYVSYEGEFDPESGVQVWDWHGRMGAAIGYLTRNQSAFPVGELYHLRGNGDVLLAFLPEDGWPITDMKLFLREGSSLPEISPSGFSFAEVYRILGEFPEEEYEKIREVSDRETIAELISLWQSGETVSLPEAEYDRYRIRVYSEDFPGLYVNVTVNVNETFACFAVERYRFAGEALLSPEIGERLFSEE